MLTITCALMLTLGPGQEPVPGHRLSELSSSLETDGRRLWTFEGRPVTGAGWEERPAGGTARTTTFRDGYEHGFHHVYYENGGVEREIPMRAGRQHGRSRMWYEDGQPYILEHHRAGLPVGPQICWSRDGSYTRAAFLLEGQEVPLTLEAVEAWRAGGVEVGAAAAHFWRAVVLARDGEHARALRELERSLETGYDSPSDVVFLLPELREDPATRSRVAELWMTHARESRLVMARATEPGERFMVTVHVVDEKNGSDVAGATVRLVHTDAQGWYFREESLWNPRLNGSGRTDEKGRVTFRTIRPGYYAAEQDPDGAVPLHLHFDLEAPGYRTWNGEFQLGDDPRARTDGHAGPVAKVISEEGQIASCEVELRLQRD